MTQVLIFPTVHLNGTSGDDLAAKLKAAFDAIDAAAEALRQTAPHGRDYYVQEGAGADGYGTFSKARDQYQARQAKLKEVQDELQDLYLAVRKQIRR